jgi:hypothetical protein
MSSKLTRRAAGAAAVIAAAGITALGLQAPAFATTPAITAAKPTKVAANSAGTKVEFTATNLSAQTIRHVDLGGCQDVPFVVTGATKLTAWTTTHDVSGSAVDGCGGANATTGATVKVYNSTVYTNGAGDWTFQSDDVKKGLFFVDGPAIKTYDGTTTPKVYNAYVENSAYLAAKTTALSAAGGQTIKVDAKDASGNPFVKGVTAKLGGKALTGIKLAEDGSYFTAVTPAHAAEASDLDLVITQNSVSSTFNQAATKLTYVAALPVVKTVTPNAVPAWGTSHELGTVTIAGTGLGGNTSTVTVCGAAATVDTKSTATKLILTAVADVTSVATGGVGYCPIVVTTADSAVSTVSGGAVLAFVKN